MTETDWLEGSDADRMLEFIRARCSERKLRLFACACCRRIWNLLPDERSRRAVEVGERFAEGKAHLEELHEARKAAKEVPRFPTIWLNVQAARAAVRAAMPLAGAADDPIVWYSARVGARAARAAAGGDAERIQANLLREIIGNPFRPISMASACLNDAIVERARRIDQVGSYGELPDLARMLTEVGCTERTILEHCRSGDDHVLGCWVVDLLLGKV